MLFSDQQLTKNLLKTNQYLAVASYDSGTTTGYVTLLNHNQGSLSLASSYSISSASDPRSVGWSPNGTYIAVAHDVSPRLTMLKQTNGVLSFVTSYTLPQNARGVSFSNDGRYVAVTTVTGSNLSLLSFASETLTFVSAYTFSANVGQVEFHPTDAYIGVVHNNVSPNTVVILNHSEGTVSFNSTYTLPGATRALAWSPGGNILGVGHTRTNAGEPFITLLGFNGSSLTYVSSYISQAGLSVRFNPEYPVIAQGRATTPFLDLYSYTANAMSYVTSYTTVANVLGLHWSADGQYLSIAVNAQSNVQLLQYNGSTLTAVAIYSVAGIITAASYGQQIRFSPPI